MRGRLTAVTATSTTPTALPNQDGLASRGAQAISASTDAATVACRAGSRVMVPAAAATMTAPTPIQNHAVPWMSG